MRKGSYSEELIRVLSRRRHVRSVEKEGSPFEDSSRIRILSPRECEVALFLHNGAAAPVASLRCAVLRQRCLE